MKRIISSTAYYGALICFVLLAFALRLHRLAEPAIRWDEGWSIAHASLRIAEIVRVAALEVHPPLFYLSLKPWLALGRNVFVVRCFSVFLSILVVPIMFRLALAWSKELWPASLTAGLAAVSPALVYYAQVLRMYPLVVLWILCAAWAMIQTIETGNRRARLSLIVASVCGLYTFYYTSFALLGLYIYGLVTTRFRRRSLWIAGGLTGALYIPWIVYAGPQMLRRLAEAAAPETVMPVTWWELARSTWAALTFDFSVSGAAGLVVFVLLVVGLLTVGFGKKNVHVIAMPGITIMISVAGILTASGAYFFAPRLLTPAVPFLLLLLAWALDRLRTVWPWAVLLAVGALAVTFWPTSSTFVYEKGLEVSGDFDPHEYHTMISAQSTPTDLVFFNELALAGWYDLDRTGQDPPWSYALRWTPIVEPLDIIKPRVQETAEKHSRLWFVLYQGTFGPGQEFKAWLDGTFYPTSMDWGTDSLFLSYIAPSEPWQELTPAANFGDVAHLEWARYTTQAGPQGQVGVELHWRALKTVSSDCRVVVQAWDEHGNVLAQRDVSPGNWEYPTYGWKPGDTIKDNHGLMVSGQSDTPLHLAISMYDTGNGTPLTVNGRTFIELGTLMGH